MKKIQWEKILVKIVYIVELSILFKYISNIILKNAKTYESDAMSIRTMLTSTR